MAIGYGTKPFRLPTGGLFKLHRQIIPVHRGRKIDDVRPLGASLEQRTVKPFLYRMTSNSRNNMAIILKIITNDQRRSIGSLSATSDPLPCAKGFNHNTITQFNGSFIPTGPSADNLAIPLGQLWILKPARS